MRRGCRGVWRGQTGSQLLAATPVGLRVELPTLLLSSFWGMRLARAQARGMEA